jgi:hypothetical protein
MCYVSRRILAAEKFLKNYFLEFLLYRGSKVHYWARLLLHTNSRVLQMLLFHKLVVGGFQRNWCRFLDSVDCR